MIFRNKITILGCGHGGMALAADLKIKGAKVALWSDLNHSDKCKKILNKNSEVILHDKDKIRTIKLDLISHNLCEVINFGDIIYNCTPMMAHADIFNNLSNCLNRYQIKLLINLSGTFSAVDQLLNSNNRNIYKMLKVFDTSSFPYACRAGDDNNVTILGRKSKLVIAPLFPYDISYLDSIPRDLRPIEFNYVENSFKLGLMGTNAVFHPATVLFNARLIDSGSSFLFYKEGISKRTSLLHEALDNERLQLAETMGYKLNSGTEDDNKYYGTNFESSYDFSLNSTVHKNIQSPTTLNHRFVTEDIGYGLVPLLYLGKLYNIELSNIRSIINIFSTIMGLDYCQNGRNLKGLTTKFIDEISRIPPSARISA